MGAEDGGFLSWRRGPRQSYAEGQLYQQDQLFGIAVQQAKITNPSEASWQNVHKQQPQEFTTWQALDDFITFIVFCAESDDSIAVAENILLCNDTAVQVTTKVDQCLVTSAHFFAIHHPFLGNGFPNPEAQPPDAIKHLGAKYLCKITLERLG
jgi:hypothetical protein